jgi:hypothetical protein
MCDHHPNLALADRCIDHVTWFGIGELYRYKIRRPDIQRSYIIPVLSKALQIIALSQGGERPLKIDEIVQRTGVATTAVYRILRTLSAYGYLPHGRTAFTASGLLNQQP